MGYVILRDFDSNTLSSQISIGPAFYPLLICSLYLGFWQYGFIDWELFYSCIRTIVFTNNDWAVFKYDEAAPGKRGAHHPSSNQLPQPDTYILLRPGILAILVILSWSDLGSSNLLLTDGSPISARNGLWRSGNISCWLGYATYPRGSMGEC